MAIKNLGNFKKTIGRYEMKLDNEIVIEFEDGYTGEDLIAFSECLVGSDSIVKIREFITKHLESNNMFDESWKQGDKTRFVFENLRSLMKGYFVMFNVTDEKGFEDIMTKAKEKIESSQESSQDSPIESESKVK